MKTLNMILLSTILTASATSAVLAQDKQYEGFAEGPVADFMSDSESRSIVMDTIATDPQMRHQMMTNMMQSMPMDTGADMRKMMDNPESKARMQRHMSMMQTVLNSESLGQEEMLEMMNSPEMKSMMKMHMLCSQMVDGEMMGMHSMEEKAEHSGQEHTH